MPQEPLDPSTTTTEGQEPQEGVEAQTEETTEPTLSPEDMKRELEKVRKEAARYRTKLREREQAESAAAEAKRKAEQTAEERAKDAEARAEKALAEAEARVLQAERRAALAGKVTNPDRVIRLMEDAEAYFDGSEPNVEAILKDFSEYAPNGSRTAPAATDVPPRGGRKFTASDLKNMSAEEINANWDRITGTDK